MTGLDTAKSPAASAGPADAALPRLLTVGHSNRELNEFIELLAGTGSEVVVDVRKLPGSNKNPWFNADTLETDLAEAGIDLRRLEGLTGRRPVSRTVPFTVNAWWQNRSFHNYADHCLSSAGVRRRAARSCARRPCGGGVTGGSSPISCSPGISPSPTSSAKVTSIGRS